MGLCWGLRSTLDLDHDALRTGVDLIRVELLLVYLVMFQSTYQS